MTGAARMRVVIVHCVNHRGVDQHRNRGRALATQKNLRIARGCPRLGNAPGRCHDRLIGSADCHAGKVDQRPFRGVHDFRIRPDDIYELKGANLHNSTLWIAKDGTPFITYPSNDASRVFTTDIDGKLVHTLTPPDGKKDLGSPVANDYFKGRGSFIPTDTEYVDGLLYMTTGYSNLDYVLTAKVLSTKPFKAEWHDLAFGGRGTGPGQLGTGHGITVFPGTTRLDIADRPNAEIDRFTRHGQYLSTLRMPNGSLPCDIYYHGNYAVVGALDGPDRTKGAPVYILENDQLISTLMIKEDLGLPNFTHVHNAVMREVGGKMYVIAQAWNPGDFAILEQVTN